MPEEKILYKISPSWKSYLGIFLWAGLFFTLAISIFVPFQFSIFFQIIIAWYVITALWKKLPLKYTVTTNRVIETRGVIRKRDCEIELNDISLVNVKQTAFQRILNISDLEIIIKGGLSYSPLGVRMKGISKVRKIKEIIEKYRKRDHNSLEMDGDD